MRLHDVFKMLRPGHVPRKGIVQTHELVHENAKGIDIRTDRGRSLTDHFGRGVRKFMNRIGMDMDGQLFLSFVSGFKAKQFDHRLGIESHVLRS